MAKYGIPKMARQLQLLDTVIRIYGGAVYNPAELMDLLCVSLRMLQRDLKDLRDSGLINIKYNKTEARYVIAEEPAFDESATGRRRQHLVRLNRLGTLILQLPQTDYEVLERYERELVEYEEYLEDAASDPELQDPEELADMRSVYISEEPEFYELKAEYYALFPDSNERTRQRDFSEMRRAGFYIYYSNVYKTFIYETPRPDDTA